MKFKCEDREQQGSCKWCQDEFCVNGDSPMRGDYCPVPDTPFVCLHENREMEANMNKQKPRVCEVLGIEPEQPFTVFGYPHRDYPPLVYTDEQIKVQNNGQKVGGKAVAWMINHPESIKPCEPKEENMKPLKDWTLGEVKEYCRSKKCYNCQFYDGGCKIGDEPPGDWNLTEKPRFTAQEIEDAKMINRLYDGEINRISRSNEDVWIHSVRCWCQKINGAMFPSIKAGETVAISKIIGGE